MSSFIFPGDSKVRVNNFTTPRGLTFTGTGVSVTEDSANNKFTITINTSSGSGEANTYSNAGLEGVAITLTKDDVDFPFKAIAAGSTKVTVTDDTDNKTVDIDIDESELDLANIGGTATWTQVSKTGSVLNDIADVVEDSPAQYDVIQRDGSSQWVGAKITDDNIDDDAAIVTTKLADSSNFLLSTLDNDLGAHYFDITRISKPSNPSSNDGRIYTKQIDTNNDGFFCIIKRNGSFQEVQII